MALVSETATAASTHYFIPQPSAWPIVGSFALFLMAIGAVLMVNDQAPGLWVLLSGLAVLIYMLVGWFGKVIRESEGGLYNLRVDLSFRWSMSWFIFSEVMFFAAFFGALFYMRTIAVPELANFLHRDLWPNFTSGQWPAAGPGITEAFTPMEAWGLPAINTFILLTSGATITWAHWALKLNKRTQLLMGLGLTILLGLTFLSLQATEYIHAYTELNLNLEMGAYGATFFMLTGFHGLHVTIGTIMLMVIFGRCAAGHFKPEHHFGFEAVSWYWHFVDVVWLLLFILVYWL